MFIEAFYDGCEALRSEAGLAVPDAGQVNRILFKYAVGYEIRLPDLVAGGSHQPIVVPDRCLSLDEQAQEVVQRSLQQSEKLLVEGQPRQAVQEILWLIESVVTAFRGLGAGEETIESKYLNGIVQELRTKKKVRPLSRF